MINPKAPGNSNSSDDSPAYAHLPISVCHVLGSIGEGGRESLLEDLIVRSPDNITYNVCGLRVQGNQSNRFDQVGAESFSFQAQSEYDIQALLRMGRFFYIRSFDVIHAHGPNAQIPCRLLASICGANAIVSTIHGIRDVYPESLLRFERLTRPLDDRTVAVSHGVEQSFVGDQGSSQWKTIQNGIDVEKFHRMVSRADISVLREQYPFSKEDTVYLNVGRYVPPKSQLDLVEAMKRVVSERTNVHLFIVGGRGAMESQIREKVIEYGLSEYISVTGQVEEIHPFYAVADMFVSSSVGEGLPIVQLEAMAAGLPVIATDIPGVRELVVDDETGILVPTNAPERLGAAMLELANNNECDQYGQAGYERVLNEFHIKNTVHEYISLYYELVESEVTN